MASTSDRRVRKVQSKITQFSRNCDSENEVSHKRRSLHTLQLSSSKDVLTNRPGTGPQKKGLKRSRENVTEKSSKKRIKPHTGPVTVFQDPETESTDFSESSVTDTEAEKLLTGPVTESYWEEIAERRRVALDESLHENEQLHAENSLLKVENAELKCENEKLTKIASHTEYLSSILQELTGDDTPEQETESEQEKEEICDTKNTDSMSSSSETEHEKEESCDTKNMDKTPASSSDVVAEDASSIITASDTDQLISCRTSPERVQMEIEKSQNDTLEPESVDGEKSQESEQNSTTSERE